MLLGLPVGYPWEQTVGICVHGNSTHTTLKQSKTMGFVFSSYRLVSPVHILLFQFVFYSRETTLKIMCYKDGM